MPAKVVGLVHGVPPAQDPAVRAGAGLDLNDSSVDFTPKAEEDTSELSPDTRFALSPLTVLAPYTYKVIEDLARETVAARGAALDPPFSTEEQLSLLAAPPAPHEILDLGAQGSMTFARIGGVKTSNEHRKAVGYDHADEVLRDVRRRKKWDRQDILDHYEGRLEAAHVGGAPELVAQLDAAMVHAWERKTMHQKVARAMMGVIGTAAHEARKKNHPAPLVAIATDGPELAEREALTRKREQCTCKCSYNPSKGTFLLYKNPTTGQTHQRVVLTPCDWWACPRCGRIRAREMRAMLLGQFLLDHQRGAAWPFVLTLTIRPTEDGHPLVKTRRMRRRMGKVVTAALRKLFGPFEYLECDEFKPRYHSNLCLRGDGVMPAMIAAAVETGALPGGATQQDLYDLAFSLQKKEDTRDRPLFLQCILPLAEKIRAIAEKAGFGPELSICPVLDLEAAAGELTKAGQRIGADIPVGLRVIQPSSGWWTDGLKGLRSKRNAAVKAAGELAGPYDQATAAARQADQVVEQLEARLKAGDPTVHASAVLAAEDAARRAAAVLLTAKAVYVTANAAADRARKAWNAAVRPARQQAAAAEDQIIASGQAQYAQPWEEEEGAPGGSCSSVENGGSRVVPWTQVPPAERAAETARRREELKNELPLPQSACPKLTPEFVLDTICHVEHPRDVLKMQTSWSGVQHGAQVTAAARIERVWTGSRLLNTEQAQILRAVELITGWTRAISNTEKREELQARLRWLRAYAWQLPP